jgi:hypothetical protein
MAPAAGHKFGQVIGEYCEAALEPLLQEFADKHGLFLDKKGKRPARKGKKLTWIDTYGVGHNLDYVLERGGTQDKIGTPVAFIECAWRAGARHSKNKAQEITGAILPIAQRHLFSAPMLGCILVGNYTSPAIKQLQVIGFKILYLNHATLTKAFKSVGIDVVFDDKTPEVEYIEKRKQWDALPKKDQDKVWTKLIKLNSRNLDKFMTQLERAVKRQISAVRIIPLHGVIQDCVTVQQAITIVKSYDETSAHGPLVKYEVIIRYDNGDKIEAEFQDRATTIEFLQGYLSGNWSPAIDLLDDDVLTE